ncbi:MAG: PEP-CTERM sorting domain-containing protein [Phycisphaerales bacterium]|nr:PEP-CTERM sorting domain-containing protein [Phycisphaerales bacterium]
MNAYTTHIVAASVIFAVAGAASAGLTDGRSQVAQWDFSGGHALDIVGNNNGQIVDQARIGTFGGRDAAGFLRGRSSDYIKFENRNAYQLSDGVIAIDFKQTGHWNSMETLFSKDSNGYRNGGDLTINLLRGNDNHEGIIQVRFQSDSASYYVNSGLLDLNKWYNMEFAFGADGMQLAVDGSIVDTNAFTGGMAANTQDFSIGAARWGSEPGEWDDMRNGYSGYISSVGIYGNVVPAPGALALLLTGGALASRRRR